jgi:adenosylcobinamide-phosphate synthase
VQLGGTARYHGKQKSRPILGTERQVETDDIQAAWDLVFRSLLLWAIITTVIGAVL